MQPLQESTLAWSQPVRAKSDVIVARQRARRLAEELGWGSRRAAEMAIVVSELASNIVKHGVRGEVACFHLSDREVEVVASDVGPPIRDLALALTDGCDDRGPIDPAALLRRGGLGTGLGAVVRLSDRFHCRQDGQGKAITVTFTPEARGHRARPHPIGGSDD